MPTAFLVMLVLLVFPVTILAAPWAGGAGPYQLSIEVYPLDPSLGEFRLAAQVRIQGKLAPNLKISVKPESSDMPDAPSTEIGPASAGGYAGVVRLPRAGDWRLRLKVTGEDGDGEAFMPVTVSGAPAAGLEMCVPAGATTTSVTSSSSGEASPRVTVQSLAAPKVGANLLSIAVEESDGTPMDGIDVWTGLTVPGMYAHVAPRKAERLGPGRYQREVSLPMAGPWLLTVDVEAAASRSLDASGQIPTQRLVRQTTTLNAIAPDSGRYLVAKILVGGLLLLGLLRWRGTTAVLCVLTALAVGEALRAHRKPDHPHMGVSSGDFGSPVPVLVERVRRGPMVDRLTLAATVAPFEEVPVTAGRAGRFASWLEAEGAAVRRGDPLARLVDGHIIQAPVAGVVARRRQDLLNVQPETTICDLARVDRVRLQARLPVLERARLRPGAALQVFWQDQQPTLPARLDEVGDLVETDSQTVSLGSVLDNPHLRLRPGQRVSLRIEAERRANVLAIPASAVLVEGDHRLVWTLHDLAGQKVARRRFVLAGLSTPDLVEIRGGLQEGDEIASWGLEHLQDGIAVTPASRGGGPYRNLLLPSR